MACNAVHAPPIWDDITGTLARQGCDATLLHLIEETGLEIAARVAAGSTVGVLGTTGTIRSDLYGRVLRAAGFEVLYLDDSRQSEVHAAIYNDEDGIKSAPQVSERVRNVVAQAARDLIDEGAQCVVLGCTELPQALPVESLSGVPVVDPSVIMARRLITGGARARSRSARRPSNASRPDVAVFDARGGFAAVAMCCQYPIQAPRRIDGYTMRLSPHKYGSQVSR